MLLALAVLLFVLVMLMGLVFLTQRRVIDRLDRLELQIRRMKPMDAGSASQAALRLGGGRAWPTAAELTAARNRTDPTGLAHPGGPA